jgi:hypothetical protein
VITPRSWRRRSVFGWVQNGVCSISLEPIARPHVHDASGFSPDLGSGQSRLLLDSAVLPYLSEAKLFEYWRRWMVPAFERTVTLA